MQKRFKRLAAYRGFSLVEVLVVCLVLIALAAWLSASYLGKSKNGEKAHTPIERAHDTECMNNIHQLVLGVQTIQSSDPDGKPPQSLTELKFPQSMLSCPVGHEQYVYDPATGRVYCPHPGHQNFQ